MKTRAPETYAEMADRLVDAFGQVTPDTPDEVDEVLKSAGLDPDEVASRLERVVTDLLAKSPHDWRSRAPNERQRALQHRHRVVELLAWSREKLQAAIRAFGSDSAMQATVHCRNLEGASTEDLARLLADLEYLRRGPKAPEDGQ